MTVERAQQLRENVETNNVEHSPLQFGPYKRVIGHVDQTVLEEKQNRDAVYYLKYNMCVQLGLSLSPGELFGGKTAARVSYGSFGVNSL